jgi:hypothetical protein
LGKLPLSFRGKDALCREALPPTGRRRRRQDSYTPYRDVAWAFSDLATYAFQLLQSEHCETEFASWLETAAIGESELAEAANRFVTGFRLFENSEHTRVQLPRGIGVLGLPGHGAAPFHHLPGDSADAAIAACEIAPEVGVITREVICRNVIHT